MKLFIKYEVKRFGKNKKIQMGYMKQLKLSAGKRNQKLKYASGLK
ncbi:hypothetical protein [Cytobacillus sp. AMY 15.2]|nr:hypothetical protein [Cytobacillus sp. AMY 15.2]